MAKKKNNVPVENKENKKPAAATVDPNKKEGAQKPDKKERKDTIPTVIPEDVTEETTNKPVERAEKITGIPTGTTSGSSLDGKAMLAFVMQQRYGNNTELQNKYPELYQDLSRNIDAVTLLALVDVRKELIERNETGELQLNIPVDQILPLQEMAGMLGITLAPAKQLPNAKDGQMSINFTESEVPEELDKDAGKAREVVPELDPKKIETEEQIIDALQYLLCKDRNVAVNLVNTVEWYRVLRLMKEENAEKKLELDNYSVGDWMNEIFSKVQPQSLLKGLGRAIYLYTSQTGSPCMGHALLHSHMASAGWSEEQIAESLKALINENFRYNLKNDPSKKPEEDKAIQALVNTIGNDYITELFANYALDVKSMPKDKQNEFEDKKKKACMVIGTVKKNYFKDDKEHPVTTDMLQLKIGQIINLYRNPSDRLAEYEQSSLIVDKEKKEVDEKKN